MKQKDLLVRGRIDTLYGNLVIEFERALPAKLAEARGQLERYLGMLASDPDERARSYVGVATDGLRFVVYAPAKRTGGPALDEVETVDLPALHPHEIYFWLDRYFMRVGEPRRATAEEFVRDFGSKSSALRLVDSRLVELWEQVGAAPDVRMLYENWQKYLRITYGGLVGDEELFLHHTYLALLARLMVSARFGSGESVATDDALLQILDGRHFAALGIQNFLEEDFFSWPSRPSARETGLAVARKLLAHLMTYNLRELAEDVLKALYQELVDPETRHELGEYYTPDWLASWIVQRVMKESPRARVLDPACGSGTFLYQAIRFKIRRLGKSRETLKHVEESVTGFDIHPLAVTIARTTYLLALGDLVEKRRGPMRIPVYMADSIRLPDIEEHLGGSGRPVDLHDRRVRLPDWLVSDAELYDEVVRCAATYAEQFHSQASGDERAFVRLLEQRAPRVEWDPARKSAVIPLAEALRQLRRENHDSIWSFVLRNVFKPFAVQRGFDAVLGNPPWLTYKSIEKGAYQKFVKDQIVKVYKLAPERVELYTHMELASLFFHRAADLYLRESGQIGFVMPRSLFSSDQHENFRTGPVGARVGVYELWDLEGVEPLFSVPASVVLGRRGERNPKPIPGLKVMGNVPRKNASSDEAAGALKATPVKWYLNRMGERSCLSETEGTMVGVASPYQGRFVQGASLVPHGTVFVVVERHPTLGFDPEAPPVRTSPEAMDTAQPAYRGLSLTGQVERAFLRAVLLSTDVVPFAYLKSRLAILPMCERSGAHEMLTSDDARKSGYPHLAAWLANAEAEWTKRRREKAGRMTLQARINYQRYLTRQSRRRFTIVYSKSGTNLCACYLAAPGKAKVRTSAGTLSVGGLIIDQTLYYFDTDDEQEAAYLSAVLNARCIDDAIKPLQSRGLWGPRDIHGKVWELPIPEFDPRKVEHLRLAELGKQAARNVEDFLRDAEPTRSIGVLRGRVRAHIAGLLAEIDAVVSPMLRARERKAR